MEEKTITEETVSEAVSSQVEPVLEETSNKSEGKSFKGNRPRKTFVKKDAPKEFEERVVQINRISKTVKGGRKMRFSALVVVGDKKGRVGYGTGKANEVPDAIKKAVEAAKKSVIRLNLVDNNRTIPHPIVGIYGAGEVVLKPASEGTGVIAGGAIRSVLELSGMQDVVSKCTGSRTPINAVRATVTALKALRTVDAVAKIRGIKVNEVR